jgi:2-methylisocitrate lyase-like PEP mutase family enzyme
MGKTTATLRELLRKGEFLTAIGVWDALGAKLVEKAGFPIVYAGGHAMAASYGYPDVGLVTMTEVVNRAGSIASSVSVPTLCDADTGYGDIPNVQRTIREMERAGIAGCHIEDQTFPKRCGSYQGKTLITKEEMVRKIRAAADARTDSDFLIIARTDAGDIEGLESTIERAKAYQEAGADAVMPDNAKALGLAEMKRLIGEMRVPAVMLVLETDTWVRKHRVWGIREAQQCGFKMAIFPLSLLYGALHRMKQVLAEIKEKGTTHDLLGAMVDSDELGALVGLSQVREAEKRAR